MSEGEYYYEDDYGWDDCMCTSCHRNPEAVRRARELLERHLDLKQRDTLTRCGYIPVVGSLGTRYHLRIGHVYNATWFKHSGVIGGELCGGPEIYPSTYPSSGGYLPDEDYVLGQLLLLVTDEGEFLSHANFRNEDRPSLDVSKEPSWLDRILLLIVRTLGLY